MGLFMAFRHRQYLGLLQPPFSTLHDKIDLLRRYALIFSGILCGNIFLVSKNQRERVLLSSLETRALKFL